MDRCEIREVTARYNRAFDDQDAQAWAELFVADGSLQVEGSSPVGGRDALRAMCARTGFGTVHITTDAIVTVDGDRARQQCTLVLARRTSDPPTSNFQLTGRYDDDLVRTGDGWRFVSRRVTLDGPR